MDRKKCFWFGTEEYADWFPAPLQGADSSPSGWSAEATLLNGGAFASNSWATHKRYIYEWPSSSSPEVAQKMKSYRDGTFGRGLIYFLDPLIYRTNVLPAHWADPSMSLDDEAPSLVYGTTPAEVSTPGAATYGLPVRSAQYTLAGQPQTQPAVESSVFIPIPTGYTLYLGAIYSSTGTGGVFASPISNSGAPGTAVRLTELAPNTSEIVVDPFSGVKGVRVWIGRTDLSDSSVTITAMCGRLIKTEDLPVYGPWVEDERNHYPNPSFESPLNIPAGARQSDEWSESGTYSLYVPLTSGYGYGPYGHGPYGHGPA